MTPARAPADPSKGAADLLKPAASQAQGPPRPAFRAPGLPRALARPL